MNSPTHPLLGEVTNHWFGESELSWQADWPVCWNNTSTSKSGKVTVGFVNSSIGRVDHANKKVNHFTPSAKECFDPSPLVN